MQKLSFILLFAIAGLSQAQTWFHNSYAWEKAPKVYTVAEADKKAELVIVLEKKFVEVGYDKDGQAFMFETVHRKLHVNSANSVDAANKYYVPQGSVIEEVSLKARCITAEGKVIPFNPSTVKSVDNLEGAGPYKIFAIDGVEVGADVEVMYTNKKQFSSYGYYYMQNRQPIKEYEIRLISPKNLVFETKSYNGMEGFKSDTSDKEKNHLVLQQTNLEGVKEEKYSADQANYKAYIMQLSYNTDRKNSRIYTWDIISRDVYTALYNNSSSETKLIEKTLKAAKLLKISDEWEKIQAFDAYLKTNYDLDDNYDDRNLEKAITTKKMSNGNAMRFYVGALKLMKVPFEMVLSCERNETKFDPKFPSYVFAKDFLLYFPGPNKYVSPLSIYSRPGFPGMNYVGNHGLYVKEVSIGDISSSTARTELITGTDYKQSYHNTNVKATIDAENKSLKLEVEQLLQGYSAYFIQPIYRYLSNEQKEEINKNYLLSANEVARELTVSNTSEEDLFKKPMTVSYKADHNEFLESAGAKLLLKVGRLIGEQAELYEENKRQWGADVGYTHYLGRKLEISIPQGYKPSNLNDLNMNVSCKMNNQETAVFRSSYEVMDNKIIIDIYEDYRVLEYPLEVYNDFKAVINAAADFNKKTLIFEKI